MSRTKIPHRERILQEALNDPKTTREHELVRYINQLLKGGDPSSPEAEQVNYSEMTVKELQEVCKEKSLPIYGTKAEIIERLNE